MTVMPQDFLIGDFVDDFLSSAYGKLTVLEECVAQQSDNAFATFCRELHSLKGNAQTFQLGEIATLCHRAEDALVGQQTWNETLRTHLSVYLVHIDVALAQLRDASTG